MQMIVVLCTAHQPLIESAHLRQSDLVKCSVGEKCGLLLVFTSLCRRRGSSSKHKMPHCDEQDSQGCLSLASARNGMG